MTNFLMITMDDMRYDEMFYMPNVMRMLHARGTSFSDCQCNVPLCSPARAGICTGQLSRYHGVITNGHNLTTGAGSQTENSAWVAVNNRGYRTGCIGKYFHGLAGLAQKPGFDFWRCLEGSTGETGLIYDAYGYTVYDGTSTIAPAMFQDHYFAREAIEFVIGTEPWALWFCPTAPHWPWTSPPNHSAEWGLRDWSFSFEADVSDKPAWIQALDAVDATAAAEMQVEQRTRLRELQAIDDAIGALVATIDATGQADNTTIVFMSDNGIVLGEHRVAGFTGGHAINKNLPYRASTHVPLVCRGPGFVHQTVTAPTIQQDATATMLAITGATALLPNQAGTHLAPFAASPTDRSLLGFRAINGDGLGFPTAYFLTTRTHRLIRWMDEWTPAQGVVYELFDRIADPYEMTNLASSNPTLRNSMDSTITTLSGVAPG